MPQQSKDRRASQDLSELELELIEDRLFCAGGPPRFLTEDLSARIDRRTQAAA